MKKQEKKSGLILKYSVVPFMHLCKSNAIPPLIQSFCVVIKLYKLAIDLLHIETKQKALLWVQNYVLWASKWDEFLNEKSYYDGKEEFTHLRLIKAKRAINTLLNKGHLFTYLDDLLCLGGPLPSTNNRLEGGINAPLRQVLREHRGLSVMRRIKAVFWWCYFHTECPLCAAEILQVMPTDQDIEAIAKTLTYQEITYESIPKWGDAIVWSELHTSDPWRHDWD